MRKIFRTLAFLLMPVLMFHCQESAVHTAGGKVIATDTQSIAHGELLFDKNCSGCHNFTVDGIGPQLGGVTGRDSADWIVQFIRNPAKKIDSGDARAKILSQKFHSVMPAFTDFSPQDEDNILAFLNSKKAPAEVMADDSGAIADPVPEKINMSSLVAGLQLVCEVPASSKDLPHTRITKLDHPRGSDDLYVVDLRGKLYRIKNGRAEMYLDLKELKKNFVGEPGLATGFGSFAFDPGFEKNGIFYTTHTEAPGSAPADFRYVDSIKVTVQWVVTEWKTDHPGAVPFSGTSREIFRINMVGGIHGMQEITFNPLARPGTADYGLLYIGIGDGGSVEDRYSFLAHKTQRPWGSIFRIDPRGHNSANGRYGIPRSNPFTQRKDSSLQEIYAYGFRNPHRITWSRSGQMLVSNIGQSNLESLYIVQPGHDYGWPIREGSLVLHPMGNINNVYPLPADDSKYHISYPVAEFDHQEGSAITGGYEYQGSACPQLKGKFLFGDIPKGRLFYVDMKDLHLGKLATIKEWQVSLNGKLVALKDICHAGRVDLRFGRDNHGELYLFTKPDGKIYRLTAPDSGPLAAK